MVDTCYDAVSAFCNEETSAHYYLVAKHKVQSLESNLAKLQNLVKKKSVGGHLLPKLVLRRFMQLRQAIWQNRPGSS